MKKPTSYNPHKKEAALRSESEAWDTSKIEAAQAYILTKFTNKSL